MGADEPVVTPVDSDSDGDEVVRFGGPRRRLPRWWFVVAVVAAGGLVAGLLTTRGARHVTPPPAPAPVTPTSAPPPDLPGQVLALPSPARAVDITLGAQGVYVLQADGTVSLRHSPGGLLGGETVPAAPAHASLLLVDEPGEVSWEVDPGEPGRVQVTQRLPELTVTHEVAVPGRVFGAALLGGRLWLAADRGLFVLGPRDRAVTRVGGYAGGAVAIAADPTHQRLLAVSVAVPAHVIVVRPDPPVATLLAAAPVPLAGATIAVTGRGIWVGGYGAGPWAVRLDPATLRRTGSSDVLVGPGATVWPGESVVWVRSGDGSNQLYCLDAATGRELASWPGVAGPVVSRDGAAYAIDDGFLVRLALPPACPG